MQNSLYQITTELQSLLDEVTQADGELTPELEEKINEVSTTLTQKTDGVVGWVNYQEDLIGLAKNRIGELQELIQRVEKRLEKFDGYVNACLMTMGTNKIEGKICTITKRKPSQVVVVFDESQIPLEFIKIPEPKPAIQKAEIGKALKLGHAVPGAHLEESKTISITYKTK